MTNTTGPFTTGEIARILHVDPWRIRRLFEAGKVPEPNRLAGARAIPGTLIPRITEELKKRDWLPEATEGVSA